MNFELKLQKFVYLFLKQYLAMLYDVVQEFTFNCTFVHHDRIFAYTSN